MQVAGLSGAEVALRILSARGPQAIGRGAAVPTAATAPHLDVIGAVGRTSSSSMIAIQSLPTSGSQESLQIVKALAKQGALQGAARGEVDDKLRELVKTGQLPVLKPIDGTDYMQLSPAEENVYGILRALQDLYGAMPKSLDQALNEHVANVLKNNPDTIARIKTGLADGSLKAEDGWNDLIAGFEDELAAAQHGRMRIQAVHDENLIKGHMEFNVTKSGLGWAGSGVGVETDDAGLLALTGAKHILPGASPYTDNYVISW